MLYSSPDIRSFECTIGEPIHCTGTGLYSGQKVSMTLLPAAVNSGVHFLRRDVDIERALVAANRDNLVDTHPCLVLANQFGISVTMVELLLAALRGCGVDNVLIELSRGEVPILDGSSAALAAMINQAGVVAQDLVRYGIWIDDFIDVRFGEHYACLRPGPMPSISVDIPDPASASSVRQLTRNLQEDVFEHDIAPVSIFDSEHEFNPPESRIKTSGAASRNNRLLGHSQVEHDWEQHRLDEFARYRIVECLGALALAEAPIFGQLYLYKPGNFITIALLQALFARPAAWRRLSYPEIERLTASIASAARQKLPDLGRSGRRRRDSREREYR